MNLTMKDLGKIERNLRAFTSNFDTDIRIEKVYTINSIMYSWGVMKVTSFSLMISIQLMGGYTVAYKLKTEL